MVGCLYFGKARLVLLACTTVPRPDVAMEGLISQAKQLGLEREEMLKFIEKQQAFEREERARERDAKREAEEREKEAQRQAEKDENEAKRRHELDMETLKLKQAEHGYFPDVKDGITNGSGKGKQPRLPSYVEGDEIDSYLLRFERFARANQWDQDRWASNLSALLTGKALDVYTRLSDEHAQDYEKVKEAILRRYDLTEDGFRKKYRSELPQDGEAPDQYITRLGSYLDRWIELSETARTFDGVCQMFLMEQFLNSCPPDLAIFLRERKPTSLEELGTLSEQYLIAHGKSLSTSSRPKYSPRPSAPRQTNTPLRSKTPPARGYNKNSFKFQGQCFNCNEVGHIQSNCPKLKTSPKKGMFAGGRYKFWDVDEPSGEDGQYCIKGAVNGKRVQFYRDTGSSMTHVNKKYVPKDAYLEDTIKVRLANGTVDTIPTAKVVLEVDGNAKQMEVGVMNTPYPVLLGNDYEMACVATRAQTRRLEAKEKKAAEDEKRTGVRPSPVIHQHGSEELKSMGDDDIDDSNTGGEEEDTLQSSTVFDVGPEKLQKQQREDPSLQSAWKDAVSEAKAKELETCFVKNKDGFLMRKWTQLPSHGEGHDEGEPVMQVVVPATHRQEMLRLAHSIPLSGHLGITRTKERVLKHFYWPKLTKDVKKFCKSCPECQKTATRRADDRHTMICPPVIGEPFRRVGIDIVGPLPRSRSGNKYVLTIIDHGTRYPEAIPMPSMEAERVVKELITFFTRVGIPKEILSDQGTNFMAEITTQLCQLLGINKIWTSPYHPQTNGMCERFNGTMKKMLRKLVDEDAKDWDDYLPYVCFAYRDTPCESTGFTPFELTYGRLVRGPLKVLQEAWLNTPEPEEDVVEYITEVKNRLEWAKEWSMQMQEDKKKKSKLWYDKKARDRQFEVGEEILVLLPTSTSKLKKQWAGPYKITRKLNEVDYEVDTGRRVKKKRIYHVNLLRAWEQPVHIAAMAGVEEEPGGDVQGLDIVNKSNDVAQITFGNQLSQAQLKQAQELVGKHLKVFSSVPGETNMAEMGIPTISEEPVNQKPYPLPHSVRPSLKKELDGLLEQGIIKESESPYCAPVVLVGKKDGGVRMCVDYRKLNAETVADKYPMPRIEELVDKVGGAKYITVIDLTKGFYQIPMTDAAQRKSAFQTPYGHFEFTRVPFGLKNSPACFQRMMDKVLKGAEEFARAFMDDIIVGSDTWEDHMIHLEEVFYRLELSRLTAKASKCSIGVPKAEYLGKLIGQGEVSPTSSKVAAIYATPAPKTKKGVRAFLGLVNYYRDFIQNMAAIAAPLTDLLKKGQPNQVHWSEECERSFLKLKEVLCAAPVLRMADHTKPFLVQTDASDHGIGAVLSQEDAEGRDQPIAYRSRKLTETQQRWSTIEKECYAIVFAVEQFRYYLYGRPFTVQTDHKPLSWLSQVRDRNRKLMRWSLVLQEYDIKYVHKKGTENANADALSRAWSE